MRFLILALALLLCLGGASATTKFNATSVMDFSHGIQNLKNGTAAQDAVTFSQLSSTPGLTVGLASAGRHYDYYVDGTADQTAVNLAISRHPGIIRLGPGTFTLSAQISDNYAGQMIIGSGRGITTLVVPTGFAGINITAANCTVSDLTITGSRTTNSVGIAEYSGSMSSIVRCDITKLDYGIWYHGGYFHTLDDTRLRNMKTEVFRFEADGAQGIECHISKCTYDTDGTWYSGPYAQPAYCFHVKNFNGLVVSDCDFIHSGVCLYLDTPAGCVSGDHLFTNTYFDSSIGYNMIHDNTQTPAGGIRSCLFTGCWFMTGDRALLLDGNENIDSLTFTGCTMSNLAWDGIYVNNAAAKVIINGGNVAGCNQGSHSSSSVDVNTAAYFQMVGTYIGRLNTWSTTPDRHILIGSGCANGWISAVHADSYRSYTASIDAHTAQGTNDFE
jgi:hypothetical protein